MNLLNEFIDTSIRPQDDFFNFVNKKWLDTTEIPEDKSRWGTFLILREKSLNDVKTLLESTIKEEEFLKAKMFYNAGTNLAKRNTDDYAPLKEFLNKIEAISSKEELIQTIIELSKAGILSLVVFYSQIDYKNTSIEVPYIGSSGLSLPEKEYYFSADKETVRKNYLEYLIKIFNYIGQEKPIESAEKVLQFETELADKHYTNVQKRDPHLLYNKMALEELKKISPTMNYEGLFKAFTTHDISEIIIDNPNFVKLFDELLNADLQNWKLYLKAKILTSSAEYLSDRFVQAHFDFFGKILTGQNQLEEPWKLVINKINSRGVLGELVGKYYVKEFFPPTAKEKMITLVESLLETFKDRLVHKVDWMSEETKTKALEKLANFNFKIGYPDVWEDYSQLSLLESDSYLEMALKCTIHIRNISFSRLFKETDRNLWAMSPQTVNAYFHPLKNEIVFPASILQFPFFSEEMTFAENFGAIGTVIGHEITHGYDDKGSKFDKNGNLNNWWTESDRVNFESKAEYFVEEYENFLVPSSQKPLNGKLTLGENIADHGGIKISFNALKLYYEKTGVKEDDEKLSAEEKFFYSYARIWRTKARPELEEQFRITDPHSHPMARVNITLANIEEFKKLFSVKESDKLFRANIPELW